MPAASCCAPSRSIGTATTRATGSTGSSGTGRTTTSASAWPIIGPILGNTTIDPAPSDIAWTESRFADLLRIRRSSPLFQLGTAEAIQQRLSFANGGPDQIPGLIVMRISDTVGPDLDPGARSLVVIFNGSDTAQSITLADTAKAQFKLHHVQQTSDDEVVLLSKFTQKSGTFSVPARTTAVFVERQPGPSVRGH